MILPDRQSTEAVLLIEDDDGMRALMTSVLNGQGYSVDVALDGEEALQRLRRKQYGTVVLDILLPRLNGFEVLRDLRAADPDMLAHVIVVTAATDNTIGSLLDDFKIARLIRKPFDVEDFTVAVQACASQPRHGAEH